MLKDSSDEEKFQKIFGGICDSLNVETLVPVVEENDISKMKTEFKTGYWKNEVEKVRICPQPFYLLVVSPEGIVLPCCESGSDLNVGRISSENTVIDIWNGSRMQDIRNMMIDGERFKHPVCAECNVVTYMVAPEDNLDAYTEALHEKFD